MLQAADVRNLKLSSLTPQERECLRLVAQQRSSKEIAGVLGISKASVDTYCNRARAKLGVATRRDAAQLVVRLETPAAPQAPGEAPAAVHGPAAGAPATSAVLPRIGALGPMAKLGVILGGAVALALSFGMLVSGLQSLDDAISGLEQAREPAAATRPAPAQR